MKFSSFIDNGVENTIVPFLNKKLQKLYSFVNQHILTNHYYFRNAQQKLKTGVNAKLRCQILNSVCKNIRVGKLLIRDTSHPVNIIYFCQFKFYVVKIKFYIFKLFNFIPEQKQIIEIYYYLLFQYHTLIAIPNITY